MIVLDANILIRAVLGRRVRTLIEKYAPRGIRFYAPETAFEDAAKYLPTLLRKIDKPTADVPAALEYLRQFVEPVDQEVYGSYEEEARVRLRGRDENDWTILASALSLASAVWTEDADFFGTGVAVWTTNRIEIFLKSQSTGGGTFK
jgi:predicted nucleic acid-binding protein